MRFQKYLLSVLFLFLLTNSILAQHIQIGIGTGYAHLGNKNYYSKNVGELNGCGGLGLENWYIVNSKIKYKQPQLPIIFASEFSFISATRDIDYLGYYSTLQSSPAKMNIDASQNIYSFIIGIEYPIHLSTFTPYLSTSFLGNYFGKTKVTRTPKPDENLYEDPEPLIFSSIFRAGFDIGIGMEYLLLETISIDLSAKYSFMNLFGKKDGALLNKEDNFNMLTLRIGVLYVLR